MELKEFLNYIQPIASGCFGYTRTDGYMTHIPGYILASDEYGYYFYIVQIPVIYDLQFTARIGDIIKCKDFQGSKEDFYKFIYFTGYNIPGMKNVSNLNFYNQFINDNSNIIYSEDNCMLNPDFEKVSSVTGIFAMNVSNGKDFFRIPIGKSVINMSKGDACSLKIYNYLKGNEDRLKTARYTLYKKKLKLNIEIFTNILVV